MVEGMGWMGAYSVGVFLMMLACWDTRYMYHILHDE